MTGLSSRVLIAIPLLVAAIYAAYVGGWVLAGGGSWSGSSPCTSSMR